MPRGTSRSPSSHVSGGLFKILDCLPDVDRNWGLGTVPVVITHHDNLPLGYQLVPSSAPDPMFDRHPVGLSIGHATEKVDKGETTRSGSHPMPIVPPMP